MDKMLRPDVKPSDMKSLLAENIVNIAKDYVWHGGDVSSVAGHQEQDYDDDDNDEENKYFPLGTLIDSLEFVSLSRGFEPEWACSLLRKLAIAFDRLIRAYTSVHMRRDIKWAENASRFLNAIYCLVEMFTRAPNATNEADK
jgi:hypothetical protein